MSTAEEKQMKDFMDMYSNIVNKCFDHCCTSFYAHVLDKQEKACIVTCTQKIMKSSERIGMRFAEENLKAQETLANMK